jgi:hypothetical protein
MSFSQSPPLPRRRPLSANEIAAIAVATVTTCPAPKNVPGGIDRVRRIDGTWRSRQVKAVKNDA